MPLPRFAIYDISPKLIHREALVAYIKGCKIMQHAHINSTLVDAGLGQPALVQSPFVCRIYPFVMMQLNGTQHSICKIKPFVGLRLIRGFTLVELMIGLLVLAILATVAIPSIQPLIRTNRLTTETNSLVTDFSFARSEAITRAVPVTLCTSSSGTACDGAQDWSHGRLVWADLDRDSTLDIADGEIRRYSDAPSSKAEIVDYNVPDPLVYQSRGFPAGAGAGVYLNVKIKDMPAGEFRDVCIGLTGQTRLRRTGSDADC